LKVVDASALLELLLGTERAEQIGESLLQAEESVHAPHLIDIEIVQALRRLVKLKLLDSGRAEQALEDLASLVIVRHVHASLLARIWELREAVSAYDGAYLAVAEALNAPLLTCDRRLAQSHGHNVQIELVK
jgi:predicted nucleic acid-binding protein